METPKVIVKKKNRQVVISPIVVNGDLKSRAERLVGSKFCIGNWQWREARESFPMEPNMRYVGKYYPNALGGPVLIDEIELPYQEKIVERKAKVLLELGYCYVVLRKNKTAVDDMMELERCRGLLRQTQLQS